jgi:hypothetical protein
VKQNDLYEKAARRVDSSPELHRYRSFILADWPEGDQHWKWVCTASVKEIKEWAEQGQE